MSIKRYSELMLLPTFEERFEYLALNGCVGEDTFGYDRYLNQNFYKTIEWRNLKRQLIIRDHACDLGVDGYDIRGDRIIVHHMNPLTKKDILDRTDYLMNPEYLICTTLNTHNAIHYSNSSILHNKIIIRTQNDTCPWKR